MPQDAPATITGRSALGGAASGLSFDGVWADALALWRRERGDQRPIGPGAWRSPLSVGAARSRPPRRPLRAQPDGPDAPRR
jgi:hypothetical protein